MSIGGAVSISLILRHIGKHSAAFTKFQRRSTKRPVNCGQVWGKLSQTLLFSRAKERKDSSVLVAESLNPKRSKSSKAKSEATITFVCTILSLFHSPFCAGSHFFVLLYFAISFPILARITEKVNTCFYSLLERKVEFP